MRRIISVVAALALMATMVAAMAMPAFAAKGGSNGNGATFFSGTQETGGDSAGESQFQVVTTPSGRENGSIHFKPDKPQGGGGGGGGAQRSTGNEVPPDSESSVTPASGAEFQLVETPSGNVNGTSHADVDPDS